LIYQDILEFIVSFLACQVAGIIPVPVAYAKGNKQMVRVLPILEDVQAAAIFCTHSSIEHLQKGLTDTIDTGLIPFMATDIAEPADPGTTIDRPAENEIAFIQYTSGSTGKPKGVVITARNLLHNQQLIKDTFGCDRDSVIFSWLPFHHDMGLIGNILHTIYVGCRCILMSPLQFIQTPRKWTRIISEYKVTHSGGPNFAYDLCVEQSLPGLPIRVPGDVIGSTRRNGEAWPVVRASVDLPIIIADAMNFTRRRDVGKRHDGVVAHAGAGKKSLSPTASRAGRRRIVFQSESKRMLGGIVHHQGLGGSRKSRAVDGHLEARRFAETEIASLRDDERSRVRVER